MDVRDSGESTPAIPEIVKQAQKVKVNLEWYSEGQIEIIWRAVVALRQTSTTDDEPTRLRNEGAYLALVAAIERLFPNRTGRDWRDAMQRLAQLL